jgi:hypothetical protein
MDTHHNDIKCVNCNEWYSISGVLYNHTLVDTTFGVKTVCGQCEHASYWNLDVAPVAILCDNRGNPLKT